MIARTLVLLPPLLTPFLAAQTTHVVSGGGLALQAAVAAAAPGDVLDVQPATYVGGILVTRGLTILLRAGATVDESYAVLTDPAILVSGLPANEVFVLDGGTAGGLEAQNCAGTVICRGTLLWTMFSAPSTFANCSGPVMWHRTQATTTYPQSGRLDFIDCAHVSFSDCRLGPCTQVTRSSVSFANSGIPLPYGFTPALRVISGSVVIAGGEFPHSVNASWPQPGPGILLESGSLVLTRGTIVTGRTFGSPFPRPAIDTLGGTIRIDPSVVLVGTPGIAGLAVVTTDHVPSLGVVHAAGTSTCQVDVTAAPNSLVFTLVNLPSTPLPLPWGEAWLPTDSAILDVAVLPATGQRSFSFALANVPPLLGIIAQPAALSPSNAIAIGAPVRFLWD